PADDSASAEDFSTEDLDSLYQETLAAMDQAELAVQQAWHNIHSADGDEAEGDEAAAGDSDMDGQPSLEEDGTTSPASASTGDAPLDDDAEPGTSSAPPLNLHEAMAATGDERHPSVTPKQVLEAALFVGGDPLTVRQLQNLLRGRFERTAIVRLLEELNQQYEAQLRPYEIQLGEGGYRLNLRDEFEPIRSSAFGLGPREIRLSQDHLEILSLVAYHQPVTREEIEEATGRGVSGVLRQLVRRELIGVERDPEQPKLVRYVSTDRFLQVFGLGGLDELPQADELSFR
ncbi:MAG: SMC-Scp complex subunit ScpB, partial [Planctomycetaceae bacterium]|nr:SMC-Scp complex subunit ScpB [Planctomycetaceae bacterium]